MVEMADCTGVGKTGLVPLGCHRSPELGMSMNLGQGLKGTHKSPVTPVVMRAGYS